MSKEIKNLILEMSAGILFHNVVLGILAAFVCPALGQNAMPIFLGLAAGAVPQEQCWFTWQLLQREPWTAEMKAMPTKPLWYIL